MILHITKNYFYLTNVLQNSIAFCNRGANKQDKLLFTNLRYLTAPNPTLRRHIVFNTQVGVVHISRFQAKFYIRFQTRFEIKAPKPNPQIRYELRRRQIVFNPQVGVVHISRLSLMLITQSAKAIQATQILQLLLCKLVSLHFDNYQAFVTQD